MSEMPFESQLEQKLSATVDEFNRERRRIAEIREKLSSTEWRQQRPGLTKALYNLAERIYVLELYRYYPNRIFLEQVRITGIKSKSGKVYSLKELGLKGRIADWGTYTENSLRLGDIKSSSELIKSVEGGVRNQPVTAFFRSTSKIGEQHQIEAKVIRIARKLDGHILSTGKNPLTEANTPLETYWKVTHRSRVTSYEFLPDLPEETKSSSQTAKIGGSRKSGSSQATKGISTPVSSLSKEKRKTGEKDVIRRKVQETKKPEQISRELLNRELPDGTRRLTANKDTFSKLTEQRGLEGNRLSSSKKVADRGVKGGTAAQGLGNLIAIVHQAQLDSLNSFERDKAENELKRLKLTIESSRRMGNYVLLESYFDVPNPDPLAEITGVENRPTYFITWVLNFAPTREGLFGRSPDQLKQAEKTTYTKGQRKEKLTSNREGYTVQKKAQIVLDPILSEPEYPYSGELRGRYRPIQHELEGSGCDTERANGRSLEIGTYQDGGYYVQCSLDKGGLLELAFPDNKAILKGVGISSFQPFSLGFSDKRTGYNFLGVYAFRLDLLGCLVRGQYRAPS